MIPYRDDVLISEQIVQDLVNQFNNLTQEEKEYCISIYEITIDDYIIISVNGNKEVYIENTNVEDNDIVFLFPYNHEKLKQLIKILS